MSETTGGWIVLDFYSYLLNISHERKHFYHWMPARGTH